MRRTFLIFALAVVVAAPARAQGLKLAFNQGRVSLDANAVPVRAILSEWAKLGGTKIVGAERVAGTPLTLKLVDVPESQALEIILRSVAGYMAAPRGAGPGASIYDRILVMATSSVPAAAPSSRPAAGNNLNGNPNNGTQRFIPPRPVRQEQAEPDEAEEEDDPNPPNPPVFTFPQQPGQPGFNQPGAFNGQPMINGGVAMNPSTGQPQTTTINPAYPAPSPAGPTTPFGTTGATVPGMIQPVPQPSAPPPVVRPPGVRPPGV